ncbi:unnamed protein product [Rotaria sp. Silwood2]|nr:unnamed protein product [Rotaria sp. Silwood2]
MAHINFYLLRIRRYCLRYSLYCSRRPRLNRIIKILSIIIIGFLFMTLINGVLFSSVLFLQENNNEPDYDLDTRPYYKTIEMKKRFDDSGNYLIVQNFVQYQTNLTKNADLIALNLHTDIEHLHLLLQHAKVWDGPISLSLYVKGARGSDDIDYASIWLRCNRRSFKVLNIHLVISAKAYKSSISNQHNSHSVKYAVNCQHITYANHTDETDSTPYPSNLLRNIARIGNTVPSVKYILTLDIDVFPSADLFHHLVSFYTKKTNINEILNRTLYVIPAFEIHTDTIKRSIALPQNKRELILLWNDEQIQPFQKDICLSCQSLTNYNAWKEETKSDEILPIFRPHYSQPWKPFYIGPKDVPMFDSRFKAHAHARISQCCESFMAGYDYAVLNNVYLYRLGFIDKSQLPNTKLIEDDTSLLLFQQFQEDLLKHMQGRLTVSSINTDDENDPIILKSPVSIKNRLRNFFGIPKPIDNEDCSWPTNTLLCAIVFLEDAVNYRSIVHKVTKNYLLVYRWFSSSIIQKLHHFALTINLCLALFERPSSFSITSDVSKNTDRIVFPYSLLMIIEGLTLIWFLAYICTKIACLGIKHARKRFWIIAFFIVTIYSLCEWFVMIAVRLRRIFRPLFMIESSQLMKKALKAVQKDLLTIIACVSMALGHILFFAIIAMFLFPRSETVKNSQGNTYFSSLHDSVFQLLVLYSTANNPDVMMPAYSDNRFNVLFFLVFVIIGIYWIQNIITAVVYRAFRGYFLNSIINSQLRRRLAIRASFEVLQKQILNGVSNENTKPVPISVVQIIVNSASMSKWHSDRINQRLFELNCETDIIDLEQYSKIMELLDVNPKLITEIEFKTLSESLIDRFKGVGRSKIFDSIGTLFALLSVLLVTIEISNRHLNSDYKELVAHSLLISFVNFSLMIYFAFEIIMKAWSFGPDKFFRSSSANILEAAVAFTCLILQIIHMAIHGSPVISENDLNMTEKQIPFLTLWEAIKICNMLFIYRLVRFLPASKNIQIVVGTVIDEIRNGGAFFGVLFSFYYAYSILGMELFRGTIDNLYIRHSQRNKSDCGTYEQLEYWPNNFNDFFSSIVTLYNIMIVNQWFVFVNGFRSATNSRWSELYFIFWYLFVTTLGLNICLALSGDIHDAKKKRANEHEELIVSNMFDIYRSQLNEPPPEVITQQLNAHPYINFRENLCERINIE